jgi:hypothetical protein
LRFFFSRFCPVTSLFTFREMLENIVFVLLSKLRVCLENS